MSTEVRIALLVFIVLWCVFCAMVGRIEAKQNAKFYDEHCKWCNCRTNCEDKQEDTDEG